MREGLEGVKILIVHKKGDGAMEGGGGGGEREATTVKQLCFGNI